MSALSPAPAAFNALWEPILSTGKRPQGLCRLHLGARIALLALLAPLPPALAAPPAACAALVSQSCSVCDCDARARARTHTHTHTHTQLSLHSKHAVGAALGHTTLYTAQTKSNKTLTPSAGFSVRDSLGAELAVGQGGVSCSRCRYASPLFPPLSFRLHIHPSPHTRAHLYAVRTRRRQRRR